VRCKIFATVFLIASVIFPASSLPAQDVDSVRRFIESTYRAYDRGGPGVDFTGTHAHRVFSSSLIDLVREDLKGIGDGEVGVLDYDPVCGCQDWDGIFNLKMKIRPLKGSDRVEASVSFAVMKKATARDYRFIILTLSRERGNWRIYDVVDRSDPETPFALRKELQKEINAAKRQPAGSGR
jgi:hypothetical protein